MLTKKTWSWSYIKVLFTSLSPSNLKPAVVLCPKVKQQKAAVAEANSQLLCQPLSQCPSLSSTRPLAVHQCCTSTSFSGVHRENTEIRTKISNLRRGYKLMLTPNE